MSLRPEHQKLKLVQAQSQSLHEFVLWLENEKGYCIAQQIGQRRRDPEYFPVSTPLTTIVAEYLGIDLKKLEDEKEAALEEQRALNDAYAPAFTKD